MSGEIVITVGFPAAGKSTYIEDFSKTHTRLNRDTLGGTLKDIETKLERLIGEGERFFVLDNSYATPLSRANVIKIGKKHGIDVKCLWIKTSIEDAQFNASSRIILKYGRLLDTEEIKANSKKDPNCFPVAVLFSYNKTFVAPTAAEGFSKITTVKFQRKFPKDYTNKALILDFDGTLRKTKSGSKYPCSTEDIELLPGRKEVLQEYASKGYILAGVSNQSGVGKGALTKEKAKECLDYTSSLMDLKIDALFCPHNSFPIACYCRKPMPGLGVELIHKYKLDPSQCIMVGDMTSDKTFAKRTGFKYVEAEEFFG